MTLKTLLSGVALLVAPAFAVPTAAGADMEHQTVLLRLHEEVMQAHRAGDVELLLRHESPDYVVASRGQVSRPSLEERRARLTRYLTSTQFSEYVDVAPPVVTVSADGSLGWVIVHVRAKGRQIVGADATEPVEFESAWIELYQRIDGRWLRVGNVSNFKP